MTDLPELEQIVRGVPWLMDVLRTVQRVGPPGAYVGAGAVRNTVWDVLHGWPADVSGDIDVVYYLQGDPADGHRDRLRRALPQYEWEVTNQATVHEWQSAQLGRAVPPYASLHDALRVWPETATAVAISLDSEGAIDVIAPHGLEDLFACRVRPSPDILDPREFRRRAEAKRWNRRWPGLSDGSSSTN